MVAQLFPDPLFQLLVCGLLMIFCQLEECADYFAVVLVLEADYYGPGDSGVGDQTFFDFEGVDVFAA